MMSDLLIGGGSVGVLTGLGYGILKFFDTKKSNGNDNDNSQSHPTYRPLDNPA